MSSVATPVTFSQEIRAATGAAHGTAQISQFMGELFRGAMEPARYANLVAQNYHIYRAIEAAGEAMRSDPVGSAFVFDELSRLEKVEADLEHFLGADWRLNIAPVSATAEYVNRITTASQWSGGYVAHHYVRFLGDLSGGQHIAKVVDRNLKLEGAGLASFDFTAIPDHDAFKNEYRRRLDVANWNAEERKRILGEIFAAYEYSTAILREL